MADIVETLLSAVGKRLAVLDGEHEHRTGLGVPRAEPAALASWAAGMKSAFAAMGRWGDNLTAQIVAATDMLLPGLSGLYKREAKAVRREGHRVD